MATSSGSPETFQIPLETAETYESAFVPAFFAQWAPLLCQAARLAPAHAVLDVACGTGIVARTAADLVGPDGSVVGLDLNDAMLTVARRVTPDLDWRQGDAAALPFPDESFDVVLSQMALMFFPDRTAALNEMQRVVRRHGTVAVLVPGALEDQQAFAPFVDMAVTHAGPEAASLLGTYFACGDLGGLTDLVGSAGLTVTSAHGVSGVYRAPSVGAFVATEVESTPLRERISDVVLGRIQAGAPHVLAPFIHTDGRVEAPFVCNVVVGTKS